jgi:NAD(P)-dependent dehydrogenase (short-subunit alcohol dehydrogenase family)
VTKGGIVSLTRCLAIDNGSYGVRANAICPGLIYTEATAEGLDQPDRKERMYEKIRQNECLGRMGQPEEVAGAAVFLAGRDSSFMTGSVLYVDGGANARLYGNVYEEYDRELGN